MRKLKLFGYERYLLAKHDNIPTTVTYEDKQYDVVRWEVPSELKNASDFRLIMDAPHVNYTKVSLYHLYWYQSHDLDVLDNLPDEQPINETHFRYSIATHYHTSLCCIDSCKRRWRALVADMLFRTRPQVLKYSRLTEIAKLSCPACGTKFRIPVVKIFGEVERL